MFIALKHIFFQTIFSSHSVTLQNMIVRKNDSELDDSLKVKHLREKY